MLQLLLLTTLLAFSASAQKFAPDPSVAKTLNAPATPAPAPPAAPAPAPANKLIPADAWVFGKTSGLYCITYETIACGGDSALHKNMRYGQNIANPNMNSIKCSRDLKAHEQIDLSSHPGSKRDIESMNASEPTNLSMYQEQKRDNDDTSCSGYMYSLHGALSKCTSFSRAASCLNLREDDN